jgi:hypothetical protein
LNQPTTGTGLVDGLIDNGYKLHLANPSAIKQYEGLKHSDDVTDAFHLANLLRLNILPEGYIYPKHERPLRDLLNWATERLNHRPRKVLGFRSPYEVFFGVKKRYTKTPLAVALRT